MEEITRIFCLYARRKRTTMREKVSFLGRLLEKFQESTRREEKNDLLIQIISQIFWIAEGTLSPRGLVKAMSSLYFPSCSYCGKVPCSCSEKEISPNVGFQSDISIPEWTLAEWQDHFKRVYGDINKRGGLRYIMSHLFKASFSIQMALDQKERLPFEIAKSLAWAIGLANEIGVDIEEII